MRSEMTPQMSGSIKMADNLLGGHLIERLTEYREAGVSFDAIANLLRKEGVEVSGETVRVWAHRLGITDGKKAG